MDSTDIVQRFVAHRGYQRHYPENTLLSFEQAIAAGAQFIELDIQLSADAVAMVFHDPGLERVCLREQQIVSLHSEVLKQISAYEPGRFQERFKEQKIITLSAVKELLIEHPDVQCYVEIKVENCQHFAHDKIIEAVELALQGVSERCVLISFDCDLIDSAHRRGWRRLGWVLNSWTQLATASVKAPYLEVVFCNVNYLDERADLRAYPWRWVVYEIDQIEQAQALFALGVDQIETFAIKEMLEQFIDINRVGTQR